MLVGQPLTVDFDGVNVDEVFLRGEAGDKGCEGERFKNLGLVGCHVAQEDNAFGGGKAESEFSVRAEVVENLRRKRAAGPTETNHASGTLGEAV